MVVRLSVVQTHKLLSRDEEQVLSKYIVAMRPYETRSEEIHQQNHQQPSDEVGTEHGEFIACVRPRCQA